MPLIQKLFALLLFTSGIFLPCGFCVAEEMIISNTRGAIVAYIDNDGRIENHSRITIGYIDSSGRVEDAGRSTLGYIEGDRVENSGRTTIGYIDSSGRVENAGRMTIGYITSGNVENASRSTVLTYSGLEDIKKIGAYIFFFYRLLQ